MNFSQFNSEKLICCFYRVGITTYERPPADEAIDRDDEIKVANPTGPLVLISRSLVGPLLRTDLTVEERILTNFELIDTIVHETAVCTKRD